MGAFPHLLQRLMRPAILLRIREHLGPLPARGLLPRPRLNPERRPVKRRPVIQPCDQFAEPRARDNHLKRRRCHVRRQVDRRRTALDRLAVHVSRKRRASSLGPVVADLAADVHFLIGTARGPQLDDPQLRMRSSEVRPDKLDKPPRQVRRKPLSSNH